MLFVGFYKKYLSNLKKNILQVTFMMPRIGYSYV